MTQKNLNETNMNQVVISSHFIDSNLQSNFIQKKKKNFDLEGDEIEQFKNSKLIIVNLNSWTLKKTKN